jgi:ribosomal protein S18 acetylase RimI-like enzyme
MLFLSAPGPEKRLGPVAVQQEQLTAVLRRALAEIAGAARSPVVLAQTLVEPTHTWAEAACRAAGMTWVGHLQFMRLAWPLREPAADTGTGSWPAGVTLTPVIDPLDMTPGADGAALSEALESSYSDTLDCPELCGLRSTRDVITSHMATGVFDPKRWWIVRKDGVAAGCCLLNHCPANHAVELVYLGISSSLRGQGLAGRVLRTALSRLDAPGVREITCAVDTRNTPALKLYRSLGFVPFSSRIGFVLPLMPLVPPMPPMPPTTPVSPMAPTAAVVRSREGGSIGTSGGQENVAIAKGL